MSNNLEIEADLAPIIERLSGLQGVATEEAGRVRFAIAGQLIKIAKGREDQVRAVLTQLEGEGIIDKDLGTWMAEAFEDYSK